jgi:vancomycin permeability regulator SanA
LLAVAATLTIVGTNAWVRANAEGRRYASPVATPSRSVAIVPGNNVSGGHPLGTLTKRLESAIALYRAGQVKAVLVSGNETAASPEVSVMRQWLLERGVPAADIWSDGHGSRTRNTMLDANERFDVTDAVICTQAAYADRALFLARHAGIDAVAVAPPARGRGNLRGQAFEAIKTTAAFFEAYLRRGPTIEGERATAGTVVAER